MTQREDWDLQDRVRYFIGASGPQLTTDEYEARINDELERMSGKELLMWLSIVFEDMGLIPMRAPQNVGDGQLHLSRATEDGSDAGGEPSAE